MRSKQEESTEEEEMKQQQRMKIMKDLKRKSDQKEEWTLKADGGSQSCWRQTARKRGSTQDGKTQCRNGNKWLEEMKKKVRRKRWTKCISTR